MVISSGKKLSMNVTHSVLVHKLAFVQKGYTHAQSAESPKIHIESTEENTTAVSESNFHI